MPADLHQRPTRRPHGIGPWLAPALGLALAALLRVGVCARGAHAGAQEAIDAGLVAERAPLEGPRPCSIDGRATITDLEVIRRSRHGHDVVARVDLEQRELRVEVLTPSRFFVTTREGEPALSGHTRVRPPLSLRRELALGGVRAVRGAPITRVTPREQALDVDVDLGGDVLLRRLVLGCEALRVRVASSPAPASVPSAQHPHWRTRGRELAIRDRPEEGIEVARLLVRGELVLEERVRQEPFVRVHAQLPYASIDGWVRDSALVPAP
jgi:hypothetical protein